MRDRRPLPTTGRESRLPPLSVTLPVMARAMRRANRKYRERLKALVEA